MTKRTTKITFSLCTGWRSGQQAIRVNECKWCFWKRWERFGRFHEALLVIYLVLCKPHPGSSWTPPEPEALARSAPNALSGVFAGNVVHPLFPKVCPLALYALLVATPQVTKRRTQLQPMDVCKLKDHNNCLCIFQFYYERHGSRHLRYLD